MAIWSEAWEPGALIGAGQSPTGGCKSTCQRRQVGAPQVGIRHREKKKNKEAEEGRKRGTDEMLITLAGGPDQSGLRPQP